MMAVRYGTRKLASRLRERKKNKNKSKNENKNKSTRQRVMKYAAIG